MPCERKGTSTWRQAHKLEDSYGSFSFIPSYQYINISADLCGILNGALCPLPEYQFDGSFAYILPDSV